MHETRTRIGGGYASRTALDVEEDGGGLPLSGSAGNGQSHGGGGGGGVGDMLLRKSPKGRIGMGGGSNNSINSNSSNGGLRGGKHGKAALRVNRVAFLAVLSCAAFGLSSMSLSYVMKVQLLACLLCPRM